jgi:HK97 family phage major capsid protein
MSEIENLTREISELKQAAMSGNEDPAVLDWDAVKDQFEDQIGKIVAEQVKEQNDAAPLRKGDPIGTANKIATLTGTRYAPMVKRIATDGYYSDFTGEKYKGFDLWLADYVMRKAHYLMPDRIPLPSEDLQRALKALSSTGSGTGDELVPTNFAGELWEDVHLSNVLVSNLERVPMTSNPMTMPNALGDVTFRKASENVAVTASDPATSNQDLTVTELVAEVDWSYSLDEDAIVALMPAVRRTVARNAAEYMDGFALNADATTAATGNINSSSAAPAADNYYISSGQDGIRHQWLTDNTSQTYNAATGALTDAHITSTMSLMGKYAHNPRELLYICDVYTYLRGFLNATTSNSPGTFIKSEQDVGYSIIATGQVGSYRGVPIVIPALAAKQGSSGKTGTTTSAYGSLSLVNRTQWKVGFMRDMMIEVDRDIQKRQIIMVVSFRQAVGCRGTRSSATHTAGIRNINVA